jgi:hypothetical protein
VTADGSKLIFTLPMGDGADSIERCDRVAKGLMETAYEFDDLGNRFSFYFETSEHDFLARKFRSQNWDNIVLVNPVQEGTTHTTDIPGPFQIVVHHQIGFLSLLFAKIRR